MSEPGQFSVLPITIDAPTHFPVVLLWTLHSSRIELGHVHKTICLKCSVSTECTRRPFTGATTFGDFLKLQLEDLWLR